MPEPALINAGEMRQSAKWLRFVPDGTVDENNHPNGREYNHGVLFCKIEGLGGRDLENARKLYHLATHQITIQAGPKLRLTDRFVIRGRSYEIGHINDIEQRGRQLVLQVQELQGDA